MCEQIEILGGAFTSSLVKGKWVHTPNLAKIKQNSKIKGSEKERPQFKFIEVAEKEALVDFQKGLKKTTIEIVKFLKAI